MKKLYTLITAVFLTASAFAQAPEKMSYQAVVRDAGNTLATSQAVGMQLSILQGSVTGTAVYVETQTPTTNINGLVSIEIGSGTVVSGTFNAIDWSNGPYFIKTETDPTGGTAYTITGTSELMSVPYALHANTADSIISGVSITETDPVFGASIANGITALDTANWNNHTVDTDTQLDSAEVANLGYNAGGITIEVDGSVTNEIQDLQISGTNLTITNNGTASTIDLSPYLDNTDTQLDETAVDAFVSNNGYLTTEVDGSITNEIQSISRTGTTVTLTNGGTFTDSVNTYTAGTGIDISASNVISTTSDSPLAIGDSYQGGIIFWLDASGQHGLIATTADQSLGIKWHNGTSRYTGTTGDGLYAGAMNTAMIVATQMADNQTGSFAAKICADYSTTVSGITFGDWYLPSKYELNLLYLQKTAVGGFGNYYWSSTEGDNSNAWAHDFINNFQIFTTKVSALSVRAIRAF